MCHQLGTLGRFAGREQLIGRIDDGQLALVLSDHSFGHQPSSALEPGDRTPAEKDECDPLPTLVDQDTFKGGNVGQGRHPDGFHPPGHPGAVRQRSRPIDSVPGWIAPDGSLVPSTRACPPAGTLCGSIAVHAEGVSTSPGATWKGTIVALTCGSWLTMSTIRSAVWSCRIRSPRLAVRPPWQEHARLRSGRRPARRPAPARPGPGDGPDTRRPREASRARPSCCQRAIRQSRPGRSSMLKWTARRSSGVRARAYWMARAVARSIRSTSTMTTWRRRTGASKASSGRPLFQDGVLGPVLRGSYEPGRRRCSGITTTTTQAPWVNSVTAKTTHDKRRRPRRRWR